MYGKKNEIYWKYIVNDFFFLQLLDFQNVILCFSGGHLESQASSSHFLILTSQRVINCVLRVSRIYIVGRIQISYFLALSHVARFYATTEQKLVHSFLNALRIGRKINQLHQSSCSNIHCLYTTLHKTILGFFLYHPSYT